MSHDEAMGTGADAADGRWRTLEPGVPEGASCSTGVWRTLFDGRAGVPMAADGREHGGDADDELVSAIFEISRAHTMLLSVSEALPEQFHIYGEDMVQLLERATARLRWVHLSMTSETTSEPDPDPGP